MADPEVAARRAELANAMRRRPGAWTTGQVLRWYRAAGWDVERTRTRSDLAALVKQGLLRTEGPDNNRRYRLTARAADASGGWQLPVPNARKRRP
ncbi:hypothetical protein AB0K66_04580 [Streptomyces werraensis]|uniref:hypothetical protein n=1 Tax=Streptomyces werraensis TaxID=68284 RepID=UPI003436400E